jgi:hypothetical protein
MKMHHFYHKHAVALNEVMERDNLFSLRARESKETVCLALLREKKLTLN